MGVALAKALGFEDITVLYLDSEPKLNQAGQQRLGEYRSMLLLSLIHISCSENA